MNRWINRLAVLALVGMVLIVAGAPAAAQGLWYKEVEKDGRVYVFNTAAGFQAWKSGEIGNKAVTMIGNGPKGETVVAENETAIDMYNFKHDRPGYSRATPKPAAPAFTGTYRMPGLRFTFPKAEINLSNRIQVRYTYEQFNDIANPPATLPTSLEDKGSFRVRRMKTKLEGWIFSKNLAYELQANWAAATSPTNLILEDANLDYDFTGGKKAFRLRFGQYKAGFGRQELTSSGSQQFVDRAITNTFAPGRQIGLQAWGQTGPGSVADMVEWRAGAYNGNGVNQTANDNQKYLLTGRVMVSPWGNAGYSESNLEGYDLRLSIGGEILANDQIVRPAGTGTYDKTAGVDVVLKAFKFLSVFGAYYTGTRETATSVKTDRSGWVAQVGWLFTPNWEAAGRIAEVDPNTNVANNEQKEWRAAVSWYGSKHNWKIQADYGEVENEAAAATTNKTLAEFRLQVQLIF